MFNQSEARGRGTKLLFEQTIRSAVECAGVGLHSGAPVRLRILPAAPGSGIIFRRVDLDDFEVEAIGRNVARVSYATSLMKKGVLISTTEHLLSAFIGMGVDNAVVELDNLEVPILDGSAQPFVEMILKAGLRRQRRPRTYLRIRKEIEVRDGEKFIGAYPLQSRELPRAEACEHKHKNGNGTPAARPPYAPECASFTPPVESGSSGGKSPRAENGHAAGGYAISYSINFPAPILEQGFEVDLSRGGYQREIAPARTFGFLQDEKSMRNMGLIRGAGDHNCIVLTPAGPRNGPLRFPDEFVRHKILDLIGDLALLGRQVIGRIVAHRAGHAMHTALVSRLLHDRSAWQPAALEDQPREAGAPSVVSALAVAD